MTINAKECKLCPIGCNGTSICMGFNPDTLVRTYKNHRITELTIEYLGFYHFYPGSQAVLVVTSGCNLFCSFCPEFETIFLPADAEIDQSTILSKIINFAENRGTRIITFYCNSILDLELITKLKKLNYLVTAITNGFISKNLLIDYVNNLDAILLRLIGFSKSSYAHMTPFPDAYLYSKELISTASAEGKFLEIEFQIIPGVTSEDEFRSFLEFISSINKNIPLHIKRFRPNFVELERRPTRTENLVKFYNISKQFLNYVYTDIWISPYCDTFCPNGHLQIKRFGWKIEMINLDGDKCSVCGEKIPIRTNRS